MVPNSPIDILESQIRDCFARAAWTHKTFIKDADILNQKCERFRWGQIVLSALTTGGTLCAVFGEKQWVIIISSITSLALLCLNTYLKNYDLGAEAQIRTEIATKLWSVREAYLSLLTDLRMNLTTSDLTLFIARRDELQEKLTKIYECAPQTSGKAYKLASEALKQNEELTLYDQEIDQFLPKELHKRKYDG